MRNKILITGVSGFIGNTLIEMMAKAYPKKDFIGIDRRAGVFAPHKNIERITTDINDWLPRIHDVDAVVHLAALPSVRDAEKNAKQVICDNILASQNIIHQCINQWRPKKLLIASCHDKDTRLVTSNGLKYYNEIKSDDIVFTLNKKTRGIEEKPINKIIIDKYNGDMIKIKTRSVDLLVTPNHKMLRLTNKCNIIEEPAEKWLSNKWKATIPASRKIDMFSIKEREKIDRFEASDFFLLAGMFIGDGFHVHTKNEGISKTGLNREEYLVKAKSKGKLFIKLPENPKSYSYDYIYIGFAIPENDRARKPLEDVLNKYNISYTSDKNHIMVRGQETLNKLFEQFGVYAENKVIPRWMLDCKSDKLLLELYKGLMLTDGDKRGRGYTTVSIKLKDTFTELCWKIGYRTKVATQKNNVSIIKGREVKCKTCYRIYMSKLNNDVYPERISTEKYNDIVWCIEVPNGNFMVERHGSYAITGNSSSVYDGRDDEFMNETDVFLRPLSLYGASKLAVEQMTKTYIDNGRMKGIYPVNMRIFTCFGPNQRDELAIQAIIDSCLKGIPFTLYGDGNQKRDFCYVDDTCRAIDALLNSSGLKHHVYNIGTEKNISINEIIGKVSRMLKKPITIDYQPATIYDTNFTLANTERIRRDTNWKPIVCFDDGLKFQVDWQKNEFIQKQGK